MIDINLEKYGVPYSSSVPANREKMRQTSLERYGVTYPCKHPEIIKRCLDTNITKYGKIFNRAKKIEENSVVIYVNELGPDYAYVKTRAEQVFGRIWDCGKKVWKIKI